MKKIDCDIFRDLFPNYIKGEISENTKEFVDNHLNECTACKDIFDKMTNNENGEDIEREEIKVLKKFNQQMIILKSTVVVLIFVIIGSLSIVGFEKYKTYKNGIVVCNIIKNAYDNVKRMQASNNYSLTINTNDNISSIFYYKDGKYKESNDFSKTNGDGCRLRYGKMDSDNEVISIRFWEYCNLITVSKENKSEMRSMWMLPNDILDDLINLEPKDLGNCVIEEEKYNNIPCYALKRKDGNFIYECLYFNKENHLLLKDEKFNYKNEITSSLEYTYSTGTVTDEDLELKDVSGYQIISVDDRIKNDEAIKYINEF